jgi:hypothetical protein
MLATPYVASLRVYEPLESFGENNRQLWAKSSTGLHTRREEQLGALKRLIKSKRFVHDQDGAHIIERNGARFVAPWSTTQRCWFALNEFKSSLPSTLIPMFFPSNDELSKLDSDLDLENTSRFAHIITETWIIPPRWFALFSPEERLRGHNSDGAFTIMQTEMELAKKRCVATHQVVRKAFGPGPVEEELVQLLSWLNIFHPHSIVECDYGGLASYLELSLKDDGNTGLDADTSIEDVHSSIEGLANGDSSQAGYGYERLISRWRRVATFEQAM